MSLPDATITSPLRPIAPVPVVNVLAPLIVTFPPTSNAAFKEASLKNVILPSLLAILILSLSEVMPPA